MAIVFGDTIYLHGVSKSAFLAQPAWVRHEVCHVLQYKQFGFLNFLCRYLVEWVKVGYHANKYEAAARDAERDPGVMNGVIIA